MSATGQGRLWPAGGWHSRSTPSFGIPLAFPHLRFGPIPLIATTLPLEVFTDSHERSQLRCVTSGLAETVGLEERVEDVVALATGAKLAKPDMLCINVWSDAAIGFTGMDFETAVRERIPILSILLNNFSMAIELKVMPISTEKYRSTDISGDYAAMARAFGGYGERVTQPGDIEAAIQRGIEQTKAGKPALLEFITAKETRVSKF